MGSRGGTPNDRSPGNGSTPPGRARRAKSAWRGASRTEAPAVRHRWQQNGSEQGTSRLLPAGQLRGLKIFLLLVVAVGLLCLLVGFLLFRPTQTPFLGVAVTQYQWPLPPNAWAAEDVAAFARLDGQTLQHVDLSSSWRNAQEGLKNLELQLQTSAAGLRDDGAIVVYLSMHGAVDGDGEPCLIPPEASALDSSAWLRVRDLLTRIKTQLTESQVHKLLVLDCNRQDSNWRAGILYNGFAEGLARVVDEVHDPRLVVLNSTGPGEMGWSSRELQGSVFGHFLFQGLCGAADAPSGQGNGDRQISLMELMAYLDRQVDAWVVAHRQDHQHPMLLPGQARDFVVAWGLHQDRDAATDPPETHGAVAAVSEAQVTRLWRQHDKLRSLPLHRFDPVAWRDIQHRLLWLEQLIDGGQAYADLAADLHRDLSNRLAELDRHGASTRQSNSPWTFVQQFTASRDPLPKDLAAHSLPLREWLSLASAAELLACRAACSRFEQQPDLTTLDDALAGLQRFHGAEKVALVEAQSLQLWRQGLDPGRWPRPESLGAVFSLRGLGESASLPADERGLAWTLAEVHKGDRARRQAEDRLFIGDDSHVAQSVADASLSRAHYESARELGASVSDALAARDAALAEIPYLAQWHTRRAALGDKSRPNDTFVNTELPELLKDLRGLAMLLSSPVKVGARPVDHALIRDAAARLRDRMQALHDRVADAKLFRRLAAPSHANAGSWRQMDAWLATPLLPADLRAEMRKSRELIGATLQRNGAEPNQSGVASETRQENTASVLDRMAGHWERHPALCILDAWRIDSPLSEPAADAARDAAPGDALRKLSAEGEEVRRRLRQLPKAIREIPDQLANSDGTSGEDHDASADQDLEGFHLAAKTRHWLDQTDLLVRGAASLWFDPTHVASTERLRTFDLQQSFLHQARRTLDDFLGNGDQDESPFFVTVAKDYLRSSAALGLTFPEVAQQHKSLHGLLVRRQASAQAGLRVIAPEVLLLAMQDEIPLEIRLEVNSQNKADWPAGEVLLFAGTLDHHRLGSSQGRSLPAESNSVATSAAAGVCLVPGQELAMLGDTAQAVAWFRGHRFTQPLVAAPPAGVQVTWHRPDWKTAHVTVHGKSARPGAVLFVLDCSSSMSTTVEVEGNAGEREVSRMQVAKDALSAMLDRLASQGGYRVGLRFYGHRVHRNLDKPRQILEQTDYPHPIPEDLLPSEDVELVLPLGRLMAAQVEQVNQLLEHVRPWGETPLYLSLLESIEDLANEEPGTQKSIVVITDGANYQYNSPAPTEMGDVLASAANSGVAIHIVGFQIPLDEADMAQQEFAEIAAQTQGQFCPADSAASLLGHLQDVLGASTYQVASPDGTILGEQALDFALAVPTKGHAQTFEVRVGQGTARASSRVELQGEEALELFLSEDGRKLRYHRYAPEGTVFAPLMSPTARPEDGLLLGVERPLRRSADVAFSLSVQRQDAEFSARPAETWVEIEPLADANDEPLCTYVFHDATFQPERPVPVLQCEASHWPANSHRAAVRLWCKSRRTAADASIRLDEALDRVRQAQRVLDQEPFENLSLAFKVNSAEDGSLSVVVLERHASANSSQPALRMELTPTADDIVHQYDARRGVALHTFYYRQADAREIADYELHVTTRPSLIAGACQLAEPLTVEVPEPDEVIHLLRADRAADRRRPDRAPPP